jgi:hypothetical protein
MTQKASTSTSTENVVDFLKNQHRLIKKLFADTLKAGDDRTRKKAFFELRKLLAVHEAAEELIVHPRARHEMEAGSDVVDERLEEEKQAKKQLAKLESMDIGSAEFIEALTALQAAVTEHADREESEEFSKLYRELDKDQLQRMAAAVRVAELIAPTRPHPGVESAAANIIAGPFASMLDRALDVLQQRGRH